nr:synaptonemal complex central element protein 3 isoform X3 [Rattus norvegicus]
MRAGGQFQWAGLATDRGGASLPGVPPSSPAAWAVELTRARAQPEMADSDPGERSYDNMLKMLSDLNKDLERLLEEMEKISGRLEMTVVRLAYHRKQEAQYCGENSNTCRQPGWPTIWWSCVPTPH